MSVLVLAFISGPGFHRRCTRHAEPLRFAHGAAHADGRDESRLHDARHILGLGWSGHRAFDRGDRDRGALILAGLDKTIEAALAPPCRIG
jgi:hypothetical protein